MNAASISSVPNTNSKFDAQPPAASADEALTLKEVSEAWACAELPSDAEQ